MTLNPDVAQQEALVYRLGSERLALALEAVEETTRAAEVTPVPGMPPSVLGVINIRGQVLPVISLRRHFSLPEEPIRVWQSFVIARAGRRRVVLVVDEVCAVTALAGADIACAAEVLQAETPIRGIAKLPDGLMLIHDLEQFLASLNPVLSP